MNDVRRCRRCKRKRLDDEPPEVRQYKTCAKCRIIERQKKKSRKPLAEETMIYGMKQFQQQHHNANFINDDVFMDDEMFSGSVRNSAKRYEQEPFAPSQQQTQQSFYQYQPSAVSRTPQATAVAVAQVQPQGQFLQQQLQQHRVRNPQVQVSMPDTAQQQVAYCEVCSNRMDLDDEFDEHYKLCNDCYVDPFKTPNVFKDYNEFLLAISKHRRSDMKNFIFIKEVDKYFSDNLIHLSKIINNERSYREFILENISTIYLDPIIASIGCKFNRVSSNIGDINSLPPVFSKENNQYQYKRTNPVKSYHRFSKEDSLEANLYASFDPSSSLLVVKLNQKILNAPPKYTQEFIDLTNSYVEKMLELQPQENTHTYEVGLKVYDALKENFHAFDSSIQQILLKLDKRVFASDYCSSNWKPSGSNLPSAAPSKSPEPILNDLEPSEKLLKITSNSESSTPMPMKANETEEETPIQDESTYNITDNIDIDSTPTEVHEESNSVPPISIEAELPKTGDNLDPAFGN